MKRELDTAILVKDYPDQGLVKGIWVLWSCFMMAEAPLRWNLLPWPGRYVGAAAKDDDDGPFEEKMARLSKELAEQFAEGLEDEIRKNLGVLGYEL